VVRRSSRLAALAALVLLAGCGSDDESPTATDADIEARSESSQTHAESAGGEDAPDAGPPSPPRVPSISNSPGVSHAPHG